MARDGLGSETSRCVVSLCDSFDACFSWLLLADALEEDDDEEEEEEDDDDEFEGEDLLLLLLLLLLLFVFDLLPFD